MTKKGQERALEDRETPTNVDELAQHAHDAYLSSTYRTSVFTSQRAAAFARASEAALKKETVVYSSGSTPPPYE